MAACRGQHKQFESLRTLAQALNICGACQVTAQCLEMALDNMETDEQSRPQAFMVAGGMTPWQQERLWEKTRMVV